MKKALITGVTGQDGSYLAELLLEKGYEVHGIKRRASSFNTQRIDHIFQDPHERNQRFHLHYGDLTDTSNLTRIIRRIEPDEVYNLGAQSHVAVSFEAPEYTAAASLFVLDLDRKTHEANTRLMQSHINVGFGRDISILELASLLADVTGFEGEIRTDPTKLDGVKQKLMDISRLQQMGWKARIGLKEGITDTYRWFLENHAELRSA